MSLVVPAPRSGLTRRRVLAGTAWAAPTIALAQAVPAFAASPDFCATPGTLFDAQSRGRLLSGSIFGADLDNLAEVEGAHAEAFTGTTSPVTDTALLTANVLNDISINLDGAAVGLSQLLSFVTDNTGVGTLNQYAQAHEEARTTDSGETGASGAVSDTGALSLNTDSTDVPDLATLDLYTIIQQLGGPGVADLVDAIAALRLHIGAVAGRAFSDSLCTTPGDEDVLERDYLVAGLRLEVESDLVGDLLSALNTVLGGSLSVGTDAIWDVIEAIPGIGPILGLVGQSALSVNVTVDTDALIAEPLPDGEGNVLQLDLDEGLVTVDLAALLGGSYTGEVSEWLNTLPANSRLFIDAGLPTNALADAVDEWIDALIGYLTTAITISIRVTPLAVPLVIIDGTLQEMLDGEGTLTVVGLDLNASVIASTLLAVANAVVTGLTDLLNSSGPIQTVLSSVNVLLGDVFSILEEVVVLTLNAQSFPDNGSTPPDDLAALEPGRYDVAALHLGAADLGQLDLLDVFLARGSIGANEPRL